VADYRRDLIKLLDRYGCSLVRHGKGSHDLWQSPVNGARFVIQRDLRSRIAANNVLKQAGLNERFD
jgi:predicted RNA binding protein YcfA (HicA-like mRNA interferase family)